MLFEDWVLGHLLVEQFQTLSGGYTEEQEKLAAEISAKKSTKWSKKALQTIEIYYSGIGFIGRDIPQDKESPPAGNLSMIPAGGLPRVVDNPVMGRPIAVGPFLHLF